MDGTLSGTPASVPTWLNQSQQTTHGGTALPTAPQPTQQSGAASSSEGTEESGADLVLPASGIPPIPQHLLKMIKQGKFVDLPDLLPEALREAQFTKVRESKDETKRKKHSISSPLDWMAAFSSYMAVAVHLKPQRAFELAGYTSIISNLAREGRGQAWLRYDLLFRQAAAINPELQWHKREPDIWLMAVMEAVGSSSTRPAYQQGQPPPAQHDMICRRWNRGSCTLPYCRYRHVCFACREAGHITRECPSIAPRSANRQATK